MLADILALASEGGRICPRPAAWRRLYELLPARRTDAYGAIPPGPSAPDATDAQKRARFLEHLEWAQSHGALPAVRAFLARLPEGEWHHIGD